jgi:hypothetical protein
LRKPSISKDGKVVGKGESTGATMQKLTHIRYIVAIVLISSFTWEIGHQMNDCPQPLKTVPIPAGAVVSEPLPVPCIQAHHYEFKSNGAEILRFDTDTGDVCQVAANNLNGWRFQNCALVQR